jgi:hypothetical protein
VLKVSGGLHFSTACLVCRGNETERSKEAGAVGDRSVYATFLHTNKPGGVKSAYKSEGVLMAEQLKPGDYIGLYIDDVLIYTGVLKDQGLMASGRKVYQVLLVKNIFQRNFPEIHFDSDIRPATWEQVQAEIKRLKIKLQKNLEQMEDNVEQLISEKELHNIIG